MNPHGERGREKEKKPTEELIKVKRMIEVHEKWILLTSEKGLMQKNVASSKSKELRRNNNGHIHITYESMHTYSTCIGHGVKFASEVDTFHYGLVAVQTLTRTTLLFNINCSVYNTCRFRSPYAIVTYIAEIISWKNNF